MTGLRRSLVATLAVAGLWARAAGPATAGDVTAAVRDQGNQPVEDVVVLAAPEGRAGPLPEKPGREIVDQINLEFVPHVKPVVVGSPVYFPNKDDVRHHVYSFSPREALRAAALLGDARRARRVRPTGHRGHRLQHP